MKLVTELSQKEKSKIIQALENDGFSQIKESEFSIKFSKGLRNFELVSTSLYSEDDLGLRIDFDFEEFMKSRYVEKTRHSKSFQEALNKNDGSLEDACKYLEWEIEQIKEINSPDSGWKADFHADSLIEVLIGSHMHIIVNDTVYMGNLAPLWEMGSYEKENIFKGTNLELSLSQVEQVRD